MSQSGLSGSGDTAGNITDLIGQCQDGYEVQLRELDRQIEDEERRIQKIEAEDRACKARTAQKEQILISIRNEKQDVLKATGEIQLELKELSEMKESLQLCLKSQEDAIGLVQQSIQGEKDEISMIENRMANRRNQFQQELFEFQTKKANIEARIKEVTDEGIEDKQSMVTEIAHLEKSIVEAKNTSLMVSSEIEKSIQKNQELVNEYEEQVAKTDEVGKAKVSHESKIREKDAAILRNEDAMRAIRLKISQLESECHGREDQNSKLRDEAKKARSKLAEVEEKRSVMQKEVSELEAKLDTSVQNCAQYKSEIDGKVKERIPEKFKELEEDCLRENTAMETLREKFNQTPSMETCNSDMINMVTRMEELKISLRKAEDEAKSLNKLDGSLEPTQSPENVKTLEEQISQIQGELDEITEKMTKTQNDSSVATAETENLKKVKDQLVLDIEEAKKIAEHLAERKKEKSALLSVNDELKSLKQKAMDEEKQKSLEIAKINTDNKKEITELEKKNESVARHFAAAKVAIPTPKPVKAQEVKISNPTPKPSQVSAIRKSNPTTATQKSIDTQGLSSQGPKTYSKAQKPRRHLVTPPPNRSGNPTLSARKSAGRPRFESSSEDEDSLFK